jgi:hypothetical protein
MGVLDNDLVKKQRDGCHPDSWFGDYTSAPGNSQGIRIPHARRRNRRFERQVNPGPYDRKRITIRERYLLIKGVLQNQSNVVSVNAGEIEPLSFVAPMVSSHDFH